MLRPLTCCLLAATAAAAAAQPAPPPAAPTLPYRSAFEDYRPWSDQPPASWKEANETVGRIGGWRAYAREASGEAAPASSSEPAAPGAPAPTGNPPPAPAGGHRH